MAFAETVSNDLALPPYMRTPTYGRRNRANIQGQRQTFGLPENLRPTNNNDYIYTRLPTLPSRGIFGKMWSCFLEKIAQESGFLGIFGKLFLVTAIKGTPKRLTGEKLMNKSKAGAVLKGREMLRNFMTHLRAVVTLIATENLKALRVLLKSIAESVSKSTHADRRS